jgi:hypothetical protein
MKKIITGGIHFHPFLLSGLKRGLVVVWVFMERTPLWKEDDRKSFLMLHTGLTTI